VLLDPLSNFNERAILKKKKSASNTEALIFFIAIENGFIFLKSGNRQKGGAETPPFPPKQNSTTGLVA